MTLKFLINFDKDFHKHSIQLLAGFQQITYYGENLYGRREGSEFNYDQIASFPVVNQSTDGNAFRKWHCSLSSDG